MAAMQTAGRHAIDRQEIERHLIIFRVEMASTAIQMVATLSRDRLLSIGDVRRRQYIRRHRFNHQRSQVVPS